PPIHALSFLSDANPGNGHTRARIVLEGYALTLNLANPISLDLVSLSRLYRDGSLSPRQIVRSLLERLGNRPESAIWTHLLPPQDLLAQADAVEKRRSAGESLPLFGLPFAVKDVFDVAGYPTTAGCPAFAYVPQRTAPV